ncbi:MAG: type II secretion system protein [Sedimentisphaerales bacterium]|nr:type II secretion system protein [Sedimentisphaerales bacterium]
MFSLSQISKKNSRYSFCRGFTLIELLVVIAIIAVLMGILMPSLRKAREQARKVTCRSYMKQIATAIGMYQATYSYNFAEDTRKTQGAGWDFKNGTADHAHEWQPTCARDLIVNTLLPNREVFFCPSVRNLSHDKNYLYNAVSSRNYTPYDTQYMEKNITNDHPLFWSTHHWIWRKRVTSGTPTVNNVSAGAMMCDMSPSAWLRVDNVNNLNHKFITGLGIEQTVEHYNVLMKDLSVMNPTDNDVEINQWLWNADAWPNG